ncbi:MAG: hypothetical protein Q4C86_06185 [bacterium]|nr:hypothetical protein [bacterium]
MKKILFCALCLLVSVLTFSAAAEAEPIHLQAEVEAAVKSGGEPFQISRWAITRAAVDGVDLTGFADYFRSTLSKEEFLFAQDARRGDRLPENWMNDQIIEIQAKEIKRLEVSGIFNGSLFERTRTIGIYLLCLFFLCSIATLCYRVAIGMHVTIESFFSLGFNFLCCFLLIWFCRPAALTLLKMSELVAAAIIPDGFDITAAVEEILKLKEFQVTEPISLWRAIEAGFDFPHLFAFVVSRVVAIINVVVAPVILVLADVAMCLTIVFAPIMIGLSIFPLFQNYLAALVRNFVTLLFYLPMAAIFSVLGVALSVVFLDSGFLAFITMSVVYFYAVTRIPYLCDSMSTATLSGAAMTLSILPAAASYGAAGSLLRAGAGESKK